MLIIPAYIGLWFLQILSILFPVVLYQSYFRKRFIQKRMQRIIFIVLNGLSIIICMTFPVKQLQDVVKLMKSYAQIHQVELKFTSTAEEEVSIKGDPGMLRFALLNIIRNGIEACSPKGCVNISLHEMNKDVYIVIEDNGNGIPKQVLSQLGKPLTSGKVNGTGLGLASTYKITESMGGRVKIESDVNKGTVFSLYFPKWSPLEV